MVGDVLFAEEAAAPGKRRVDNSMDEDRYIVIGDMGVDYGWVVDNHIKGSWWDKLLGGGFPQQATIYGGARADCRRLRDKLNHKGDYVNTDS